MKILLLKIALPFLGLFIKKSAAPNNKVPASLKEFELMTLKSWNETHLENHFSDERRV